MVDVFRRAHDAKEKSVTGGKALVYGALAFLPHPLPLELNRVPLVVHGAGMIGSLLKAASAPIMIGFVCLAFGIDGPYSFGKARYVKM